MASTSLSAQAKSAIDKHGIPELAPDIKGAMDSESLDKLSQEKRSELLDALCDSLNLNRLTSPFRLIVFQGKTKIYATKDCTEQLRRIYGISAKCVRKETVDSVYEVEVEVSDIHGRTDFASGGVGISKSTSGDAMANARMKAETKAKRRATLSICGLGLLDESEIETLPGEVKFVDVQPEETKLDRPKPIEEEDKAKAEEGDLNFTAELVKAKLDKKIKEVEKNPEPELGGVIMSEEAKAEEEKKKPPPKHITIAQSKLLFRPLTKDQVPDFKRFLTWVSAEVWKDNPPIESTSQILEGDRYNYLLDAVTLSTEHAEEVDGIRISGFLMWLEENPTPQPASHE